MPLPLPNLDTRRWSDLIDEGRALIPRYAPPWTDHNIHDPGIALMELLAALVEQDIYRLNQVPDRHRRKFLALAGFAPRPPRPAQTVLAFTLAAGAGPQPIPAGTTFVAAGSVGPVLYMRTLNPVTVNAVQLRTLQVFDGSAFSDQTRSWQESRPIALLGSNPLAQETDPEQQPAFYLGFEQALPPDQTLSFWFSWGGLGTDLGERYRLQLEYEQAAANCLPARPTWLCPVGVTADQEATDSEPALLPGTIPPHHAICIGWDYYEGNTWRELDPEAGQVRDETRGLTLNGAVHIRLPGLMAPVAVGAISEARPYLRCRLKAGPPDAAPILEALALNASLSEQVYPTYSTFQIAPGVIPPAGQDPKVGESGQLELSLDLQGRITSLAFAAGEATAESLILDYEAAEVAAPGRLTTTLNLVGWGSGAPGQRLILPNTPLAHGQVKLWINHDGHLEQWQQRPDLDASRRVEGHYMVNSTTGVLQFGDGEQGRVVPAGAAILAAYETTQAAKGNIAAGTLWQLAPNEPLNEAILTVLPDELAGNLAVITNPMAGEGGAEEETVNQAAGRLAEAFWAHERLVERCPPQTCATLDQLERATVLALAAPARATTLLDFERLALDVPGTHVARARAWAGMDPAYPCLKAPGTVTVVIVPELPRGRPQPSPGLLQTVRRYLGRRRVVGTRLLVVGPDYVTVSVQAQVRTQPGVRPERVREALLKALNSFLDPLVGGPQGHGWPFGRDVYRSEIMQVIDQVPGVDHVLALELSADGGEAQCGNLCIGPTTLVTPGQHHIQLS